MEQFFEGIKIQLKNGHPRFWTWMNWALNTQLNRWNTTYYLIFHSTAYTYIIFLYTCNILKLKFDVSEKFGTLAVINPTSSNSRLFQLSIVNMELLCVFFVFYILVFTINLISLINLLFQFSTLTSFLFIIVHELFIK